MVRVAKGTILDVELVDPVSSAKSKAGDEFRARVGDGVWIKGRAVIPPGTTVHGKIVEATPSGRMRGRSKLSLTLESVNIEGSTYTVVTDTLSYVGDSHTGQNIGSWLQGALSGAMYGVLFGGKTGAVIGAGAGAAAGAGSAVLAGKIDVEFKQGSKLMFETQRPISVPWPTAAALAPPPETKPPSPSDNGPGKPTGKEGTKPEAKPST